jgi:hypothetical protein
MNSSSCSKFDYPDQVNGQVADAASEHFHITAALFPWLKA